MNRSELVAQLAHRMTQLDLRDAQASADIIGKRPFNPAHIQ